MLIQNKWCVNSSIAAVNLAVAANLLANLCDVKVKPVLPKKNKVKQEKAKMGGGGFKLYPCHLSKKFSPV